MYLYRFRNIKNLLDRHELENQEIYFCPPAKLNDPTEGFQNVYWSGCEILWKNFIENYLICFYEHLADNVDAINISNDFRKETKFDEVLNDIFNCSGFLNFISFLKEESVSRKMILLYLAFITPLIFSKILPYIFEMRNSITEILNNFSKMLIEELGTFNMKSLKDMQNLYFTIYMKQFRLASVLKKNQEQSLSKQYEKMLSFPAKYINEIVRQLNPNWYAACFMKNADSFLNWTYYANGHEGVCLIYSPIKNDGDYFLNMNRYNLVLFPGLSEVSSLEKNKIYFKKENAQLKYILMSQEGEKVDGVIKINIPELVDDSELKVEYLNRYRSIILELISENNNIVVDKFIPQKLHEINYDNEKKNNELEFFCALSHSMRISRENLYKRWYSRDNVQSEKIVQFMKEKGGLCPAPERAKDFLRATALTKISELAGEEEYRLYDTNDTVECKKGMHIVYDFSQLHGIIFGMKTDLKYKNEIIKLIEKKCILLGRKDFKFYEASYCHKKRKMTFENILYLTA